ncbi:RNB domain-containing ribonuclease [Eggerthellaceae bacterium zg-1084]|uniref:ribonuclease R family protein n=1 Tax=Berryella wangjianweii TaxID=2734634 RepID=UPI001556EBAB|nr:RNB domain-containing ribonuclease [Berryella wangjianweii]NPD31153.1 RNB domain-containing ribonuclease [Berryella wangjianweii]
MARRRFSQRRRARSLPRGRIALMARGSGIVSTAEGEFFVPASHVNGAFDGDFVELSPLPGQHRRDRRLPGASGAADHRRAARVARVLERAHTHVVGTYRVGEPFGVVTPHDERIPYDVFILNSLVAGSVPNGALVNVRIEDWPTRYTPATGVVEEVLGDCFDERVMIDLIVAAHQLETEFSTASLEEAAAADLGDQQALREGYRDIRDRLAFTVDPVDARDYDDALSFEAVSAGDADAPRGSVWRVGVHIADVSRYVPWGSAIDGEARRRATSAYLVDRVIPMLPERLSNDLCSLVPHATRLCMTVDLYLDARGRVLSSRMYPALMRSQARLTYDFALALLQGEGVGAGGIGMDGVCGPCGAGEPREKVRPREAGAVAHACKANEAVRAGEADATGAEAARAVGARRLPNEACVYDEALVPALRERLVGLSGVAQARKELRRQRGGLDFDTVEAKVVLDDAGVPREVRLREKTLATELVEEAMIMANEAVARYLRRSDFPSLYRVHEAPDADELEALVSVLQEFSWMDASLAAGVAAGSAHALARAMEACAGRPEHDLVCMVCLRSMKRAAYAAQPAGHYGLASDDYTHFTSPIRRYPDLVVHRMLKARLFGKDGLFDQQVAALRQIAEHSSQAERRAEAAARDSQQAKMVELMEGSVGSVFSAQVSGVTGFGLFVRLENTAEGLLPASALGREYFSFDPLRRTLTGQGSGRMYRLGQHLAVRLDEADRVTRRLTFSRAGTDEPA